MTMKTITEQVGTRIAKQLPGFQFQRQKSRLYRQTESGWQAVFLAVHPTSTKGIGKLAAHGQVRHDRIEALYTPFIPYLRKSDIKSHPTIAVNCDSLLTRRELVHGFQLEPASILLFADSYAAAIRTDVIPWLENYSNEQVLFEGLTSRDPKNWATSDRLTRFPVLMAILAIRGDAVGFDTVASEFADWCRQKHALCHAPLAQVMLGMRPTIDSNKRRRQVLQ